MNKHKALYLFLSFILLSGLALGVGAEVTIEDSQGISRPVDSLCVDSSDTDRECKSGQSTYSFELESEGNYDFSLEDDRYQDIERTVYVWQDSQDVTITVEEDSDSSQNDDSSNDDSQTGTDVNDVKIAVEDSSGVSRPMDRITVESSDSDWEKNWNGKSSFTFDAPSDGNYRFSINDDRYDHETSEVYLWEDGQQVDLRVEEKDDSTDNDDPEGYTVDVRVEDDSGILRPVDKLRLEDEDGSNVASAQGRSTASFTVSSKGNYELEVEDDRWDERTGSVYIWEDDQPVTLTVERKDERDDRPSIDLRQPYNSEDHVSRTPLYKWKITDDDDYEMEDTTLYIEEKDFSGDDPWNVPEHKYNVDDDVSSVESFRSGDWLDHGQEYVWGIKADDGEHTVKSEVYSFRTEGKDGDDHDDDHDADEGTLTVTVRDGESDRLENAFVKIQNGDYRTGRTDYRGEAEFVSLDPDWYDIEVRCDGETETDRIHVGDDEDEEITVRMDSHSSDDYCGDGDADRPDASFTVSDSSPEIDESVRFDASGSDGDIMEYRWAFPDGTTKYGEVVYRSFDSSGRKNVQLRVTEYDYDQDTTSRSLDVQRRDDDDDDHDEDREDPVARLDIDPSSAEIGEEVEFDATDSSDGEIEEYKFDLDGDGDWDVESDDGEVERTFFEEFDGFARVEVEDEDGNTDIDSEHYEVRSRGRVSISDVESPEKICGGESFEVDFRVRNLGDDERYVVVEGRGFGETRSAVTELEEDEEQEMTLTFNSGSPGSKSFTLSASNSNTERRTVEVLDCDDREADVSDISVSVTPTRVNAGEAVKVSGYVENTRGRENVRILMDGALVADTSTSPDGYYQVYAYPEEIGRSSILASSGGMNARTSVEVLPTVQVSGLEVPDNIFQGESFEVCGQVTTQADALVLLRRNGETIDSKHGNGKVCFDTVSNTAGETQYSIGAYARGAGDSVSREVEILETKPETSSFPGKIASVESGDGIVKATIYNNHDEQRRYDVDLSGLPGTWTSTSGKQVILQPGEEREVFFYLTPQSEGRHLANIRIESQGSTIYDEDVEVITGGTSENRKRSIMWRLRNAVPWW